MSILRLYPSCIECMKDKRILSIPSDAKKEQRDFFIDKMQEIFKMALPFESAPVISSRLSKLFFETFGIKKDLTDNKLFFNNLLLKKEQDFYSLIKNNKNPLELALKYSIIANYIDFSSVNDVNEETLFALLTNTDKVDLTLEYDNLVSDLKRAKRLLFICDNCGEVILDKLLLKTIKECFPNLKITLLVRGLPVDVDVTIADAKSLGLDLEFDVISSESDIPGTFIEGLPQIVKHAVFDADVIMAKGQGNFESMQKCNLNVYYLFMCKCQMFTNRFNVARFTGKLINERRIAFDR